MQLKPSSGVAHLSQTPKKHPTTPSTQVPNVHYPWDVQKNIFDLRESSFDNDDRVKAHQASESDTLW